MKLDWVKARVVTWQTPRLIVRKWICNVEVALYISVIYICEQFLISLSVLIRVGSSSYWQISAGLGTAEYCRCPCFCMQCVVCTHQEQSIWLGKRWGRWGRKGREGKWKTPRKTNRTILLINLWFLSRCDIMRKELPVNSQQSIIRFFCFWEKKDPTEK